MPFALSTIALPTREQLMHLFNEIEMAQVDPHSQPYHHSAHPVGAAMETPRHALMGVISLGKLVKKIPEFGPRQAGIEPAEVVEK